MLDRLTTIAAHLITEGHGDLAREIEGIRREAQNLAPRDLKTDPMAGYTDPASVQVQTKKPTKQPLPPRKPRPQAPRLKHQPIQQPPAKTSPEIKTPYKQKSAMINELAAIATDLDTKGHYNIATRLDELIEKEAQGMLSPSVQADLQNLANYLMSLARARDPNALADYLEMAPEMGMKMQRALQGAQADVVRSQQVLRQQPRNPSMTMVPAGGV